jgi:hypothetical protein
MHEQTPRNLPWLDRLAVHIPGYGGYLERGNRRAADRALRDAIAHRLGTARANLEKAVRACLERDALGILPEIQGLEQEGTVALGEIAAQEKERHQLLTEVSALERIRSHLDRVINRLGSAGSGADAFYSAGNLDLAKADSLHAFDLDLFERADALVRRFDAPDLNHDFLAELEADLTQFEEKLDERAMLLQGIR